LPSYSVCLKPFNPIDGGVISVSHVIRGLSLQSTTASVLLFQLILL